MHTAFKISVRSAALPPLSLLAGFLLALTTASPAQTAPRPPSALLAPHTQPAVDQTIPETAALSALPDSPGTTAFSSSSHPGESSSAGDLASAEPGAAQHTPPPGQPGSPLPKSISATQLVVAAGQTAPRQTAGDKIVSSLRTSVSPFSFAGEVIAAGYSQAIDSAPNYGRDTSAFGQRLGAAVARGTSQSIFTVGVLAPLLREDPRYYQLGRGHGIVNRGVYAATRPFITRTDDGRPTPNLALLGGYLGAAALTPTYYPDRNQGIGQVFGTYATSLGGAAIGGLVHEFLPEVLQAVHLK